MRQERERRQGVNPRMNARTSCRRGDSDLSNYIKTDL